MEKFSNKVSNSVIFILLSVLLGSCTASDTEKPYAVATITQLLTPPDKLLSDIVESVRFIPLETNDSVLLKRILAFQLFDDCILIKDKTLYQFGLDGKYKQTTVTIGPGPEEVPYVGDYTVYNGRVYVTTSGSKCKVYDLNGHLIDSFTLPVWSMGMTAIGENRFVAALAGFGNSPTERFAFISKEIKTKVVPRIIPPGVNNMESYSMGDEANFHHYDGQTYMKELLNDTIYRIDVQNEVIIPEVVFDFGKMATHTSMRYDLPMQELYMRIPYTIFVGMNNRYCFLLTMCADMKQQKSIDALCWYDKRNSTSSIARLVYTSEQKEQLKALLPNHSNADQLNYFTPTILSENGECLASWIQPENDENPVIIMAKLKKD